MSRGRGAVALLVAVCVATMVAGQTLGQAAAPGTNGAHKVICHYDSKSFVREGLGKFTLDDLGQALHFCTHVVYGHASINPTTHKLEALNPSLDLDQGQGHYRLFTQLRLRFPTLKFLLSVGGNDDHKADEENPAERYNAVLENSVGRVAFINSAYALVKTYNFDGLDLAWQWPADRPRKIKSGFGSFWSGLKSSVGLSKGPIDEKAEEHREEFTALVRELKNAFRHDNYLLTLTVNPSVNSTLFVDIPAVINNLDYVVLPTYDFQTPQRNPKEADHPAPSFELNERLPQNNINAQVRAWTDASAPKSKLIVAIPTYGRAWKLEKDATSTGVPPVLGISEPAPAGPQSGHAGLLSYPEICSKLPNPSNNLLKGEHAPLRKVGDPTRRFGTYAYRLPDGDGNFGIWVGYEDPETAANKAGNANTQGLGGVAIVDLSYDDFRGTCTGDKFPLLRAAKQRL